MYTYLKHFNVSLQVEAKLAEHPGIKAAAVVGIPHSALGEQIAALIVLESKWHWSGVLLERIFSKFVCSVSSHRDPRYLVSTLLTSQNSVNSAHNCLCACSCEAFRNYYRYGYWCPRISAHEIDEAYTFSYGQQHFGFISLLARHGNLMLSCAC